MLLIFRTLLDFFDRKGNKEDITFSHAHPAKQVL